MVIQMLQYKNKLFLIDKHSYKGKHQATSRLMFSKCKMFSDIVDMLIVSNNTKITK